MNLLEQFKRIKTFVFDVDGVLTDGTLIIPDDGQMVRKMNIKDGYALQLALKRGYRVVIISGGTSDAVRERLSRLGVTEVFMNAENKKEILVHYVKQNGLAWNEILFMGDDIPDYTVMQMAGLTSAPRDAAADIRSIADYISPVNGGSGCVRDVVEKVLKLNNDWPMDTSVQSK